jgi:hypothetical protein
VRTADTPGGGSLASIEQHYLCWGKVVYPCEMGEIEAEQTSESEVEEEAGRENQEVVLSGAEANGTSGFM